MSGVVPDGVASVTLRFPKASVTARPIDNVFVVREPRGDNPRLGLPGGPPTGP